MSLVKLAKSFVTGAVGGTPTPERLAVCGDPLALSVTENVPKRTPN